MDCKKFKENINKYILDNLEHDERESFEEHYFGCQDCFNLLELKDKIASILEEKGVENILGSVPEVDRVEALIEYSDAAVELEDYEEAVRLLKKALELKPDDEEIFGRILDIISVVEKKKQTQDSRQEEIRLLRKSLLTRKLSTLKKELKSIKDSPEKTPSDTQGTKMARLIIRRKRMKKNK